jgi:type IV pilus assembly protein PilY1
MSLPATAGDPTTVPPIPPNLPDPERLPDRPFKLGDVFHSSPVVVDAPSPSDGVLCNLGFQNQCLRGLWAARLDEVSPEELRLAEAEYQKYASHYRNRRRVILVGSNSGLVHAFNGGTWHPLADDPVTTGIDESKKPFYGYYDRGDPRAGDPDEIWAEELWAFLPPDMIGKLSLVFGGEHQIFVDGSAMVRDMWADGTANGIAAATTWDDLKQAQEFHTVAVFGERRGGTHYFALDVSDATKLASEARFEYPRFLWLYPQPDDKASLVQGETYTDFLPVPPPIGPVRIRADTRSGSEKAGTPRHEGVPYHERWVAFLSGGFDPQYVRGRGVHMVDAWTGAEYFDFSYPYNSAGVLATDPRWDLRYPVAATVGMVQWGPGSRRENGLGVANNYFFDTATFGDTGGQLWVLRFHEPGILGSDGKATNWLGARVFQMGGNGPESLGYAYPFFYITSNVAMPGEYTYRVYSGTGDRFNLLDQYGGLCGPDNLRACVMRGCTATVDLASNLASTPELGKTSGSLYQAGRNGTLNTTGQVGAGAAGIIQTRARLVVSSCPSPEPNNGSTGFTKDVTVTCSPDAKGRWGCSAGTPNHGVPLTLSNTTNAVATRNWFYSLKVFDDDPNLRIPFQTAAQAKGYDDKRYWIKDTGTLITQCGPSCGFPSGGNISIMAASVPNPAGSATATSPGWAIYYDHGPTVIADGHSYTVAAVDERTSSVNAVGGAGSTAMITWNTTQPPLGTVTSANGSCFASKCTAEDRRLSHHYAAHPMTGGSVLKDELGNPIRAQVGNTLVPSQGDQTTVFVNQRGQVQMGPTVVNPEKGAATLSAGGSSEALKEVGWIEVPKALHECRHEAKCD